MARKPAIKPADSTTNLGFEAKLSLAADELRNNMDAAEYKYIGLGLIFLKYISNPVEDHRAKPLQAHFGAPFLRHELKVPRHNQPPQPRPAPTLHQ